jgi:hypothetical protein
MMRLLSLSFIFLFVFPLVSCSSGKNADSTKNDTVVPPDTTIDNNSKQQADSNSIMRETLDSSLLYLQLFGQGIDDKSMQDLILLAKDKGLGFKTAANSCFYLNVGDMPVETCKVYVESIRQGRVANNVFNFTSFLYRSIKPDYPDLAERLLKNCLDDINKTDNDHNRTIAKINAGSIMYLKGIDDGKKFALEGKKEYIDAVFQSGKEAVPVEVLNLTASLGSVDFEEAWDFVQKLITNDFIQVEGKAAMAGGLMKTQYETGRQYYSEALDEIYKFPIAEQSSSHTAFEFGFSRLNDKDKAILLPKYLKAMSLYNRFELLPQADQEQLISSEPKVSAEYLDALYKWLKSNKDIENRLQKFHAALTTHCTRTYRSNYTPIFLGWALEWIDEIKDPYKKFIALGQFITIQNGLIPNNFAVAKPKIQKIAKSIEGKLPPLDIRDSMLEIILFKNPKRFKELLGDGKILTSAKDLMLGMSHSLHYRHYMYPDDDAGLSTIFTDLFSQWTLPEGITEMDRQYDIVLNLSGWNNNKAWEKLALMDSKDGQYPMKLVQLANMIRPFSPEFSQRLIDDLMDKFRKKNFDLTNPSLEKEVASSLVLGNLDWAIQFSKIITEQRGNNPPLLSWYSITTEIVKSINRTKTEGPQVVELSSEIYKKLTEDLERLEKVQKVQKVNDEAK